MLNKHTENKYFTEKVRVKNNTSYVLFLLQKIEFSCLPMHSLTITICNYFPLKFIKIRYFENKHQDQPNKTLHDYMFPLQFDHNR